MLYLPTSGQCYYTVAFSPDGRWIAAGGSARGVDLWDLHSPRDSARWLPCGDGPVVRAAFSPVGQLVIVTTGGVWRFDSTNPSPTRTREMGRTHRAAVAPDGAAVIVCGGMFQRWATAGPGAGLDWTRVDDTSNAIKDVVTVEGLVIVAGAPLVLRAPGFVEVRDPDGGRVIDSLQFPHHPLRVACSANGDQTATLTNGNLSVWHLPTRSAVADHNGPRHGGWLSLAFAPHGRRIVTGGIDSTVGVWDALADAPPLRTFQWGVGPVYAVAFDRDGLRAAAAGHSGVIVWDVDE